MLSATVPNAPIQIPAWRRLGLKLKSGTESPTIETVPEQTPKRKRIPNEDSTPSKKAKRDPKSIESSQSTSRLERKKSVTFTPETKIDDGDSIKQLFNSWKDEQKAQDPSFDFKNSAPVFTIPEPSQVDEQVNSTLSKKEQRVERIKKPQQKQASKPVSKKPSKISKPLTSSSRPFLKYLKQYTEARDSWKFNKNHQNHLLKHAFNLEVVPSDHIHLLYEYVKGLQGGVRTRLRDTALGVKVQDQEEGVAGFPETMSQPEKRQREYEVAMNKYVATMTASGAPEEMGYEEGILLGLSDKAMEGRVAKRMRAERVLAVLASTPENTTQYTKTPPVVNGKDGGKEDPSKESVPQKVARKRKQRTITIEDSDSDSDSDSSGSDSSDDVSAPSNPQQEDTSSSSSSSSSESDSEEGDAEENSEADSEDSESE